MSINNKHFTGEFINNLRKFLGIKPIVRKLPNEYWAACNRFSGEVVMMGELHEIMTILHTK